MSTKRPHSKKRNSALLYEFLVRKVSSGLVTGNKGESRTALKLIKKYFKPGTEIYKEFRLANALAKTRVTSLNTAAMILNEARSAARKHDEVKLQKEKSCLIGEINRVFDTNFYEQRVPDYRELATVQVLINDWRAGDNADLTRIAEFEDALLAHLTQPHELLQEDAPSHHDPGTDKLLERVMLKKLNDKYSSLLPEQKLLIKEYAWSSDDGTRLKEAMKKIREDVISLMEKSDVDSNYASQQLNEVKQLLVSEDVSVVDDAKLEMYLTLVKLREELSSGEK